MALWLLHARGIGTPLSALFRLIIIAYPVRKLIAALCSRTLFFSPGLSVSRSLGLSLSLCVCVCVCVVWHRWIMSEDVLLYLELKYPGLMAADGQVCCVVCVCAVRLYRSVSGFMCENTLCLCVCPCVCVCVCGSLGMFPFQQGTIASSVLFRC